MKIKHILKEWNGREEPDDDSSFDDSDVDWDEGYDEFFDWLAGDMTKKDSHTTSPLDALASLGEKWVWPNPFIKKLYDWAASNPKLKAHFEDMHPLEEAFLLNDDVDDFIEMFRSNPVSALKEYAFNHVTLKKDLNSDIAEKAWELMQYAYNNDYIKRSEPEEYFNEPEPDTHGWDGPY